MNTSIFEQEQTNDHEVIMSRISAIYKQKLVNLGDIIEWSSECETEWIQDVDTMIGYAGIRLEIRHKKTLLPCNLYKISRVYTNRSDRTSSIAFRKVGRWLYVDRASTVDHIYIDFYGLQIDENGIPIILDGHIQACQAFCVEKLFIEDYSLQKISGAFWQYVHDDAVNKMRETRATLRAYTDQDLINLQHIQYNLVPKIGSMAFEIEDIGTHFLTQ